MFLREKPVRYTIPHFENKVLTKIIFRVVMNNVIIIKWNCLYFPDCSKNVINVECDKNFLFP